MGKEAFSHFLLLEKCCLDLLGENLETLVNLNLPLLHPNFEIMANGGKKVGQQINEETSPTKTKPTVHVYNIQYLVFGKFFLIHKGNYNRK